MRKYEVVMPFTGSAYMEVEAETAEQAKEKFWETAELIVDTKATNVDVEIEFTEHVTRGNVCYAVLSEVSVEELDE